MALSTPLSRSTIRRAAMVLLSVATLLGSPILGQSFPVEVVDVKLRADEDRATITATAESQLDWRVESTGANQITIFLPRTVPGPAALDRSSATGLVSLVEVGFSLPEGVPTSRLIIHGRRPIEARVSTDGAALTVRVTAVDRKPPAPVAPPVVAEDVSRDRKPAQEIRDDSAADLESARREIATLRQRASELHADRLELVESLRTAEAELALRSAPAEPGQASAVLEAEATELRSQLEEARGEVTRLEDTVARVEGERDAAVTERGQAATAASSELETLRAELDRERAARKDDNRVLEEDRGELTALRNSLAQVEAERDAAVTERGQAATAASSELETLRAELDRERTARKAGEAEFEEATSQLERGRAAVSDLQEEVQSLEQQLTAAGDDRKDRKALTALRQERDDARGALTSREEDVQQLNRLLREKGTQIKALESQVGRLQTGDSARQNELQTTRSELVSLRETRDREKAELDTLKRALATAEKAAVAPEVLAGMEEEREKNAVEIAARDRNLERLNEEAALSAARIEELQNQLEDLQTAEVAAREALALTADSNEELAALEQRSRRLEEQLEQSRGIESSLRTWLGSAPSLLAATKFVVRDGVDSCLALRPSPDPASGETSCLPAGAPLEVLSLRPDWFRVRTPDGQEGWVRSADAAPVHAVVEQGLKDQLAQEQSETQELSQVRDDLQSRLEQAERQLASVGQETQTDQPAQPAQAAEAAQIARIAELENRLSQAESQRTANEEALSVARNEIATLRKTEAAQGAADVEVAGVRSELVSIQEELERTRSQLSDERKRAENFRERVDESQADQGSKNAVLTTAKPCLTLRADPGVEATRVDCLVPGTRLAIRDRNDDWLDVTTSKGLSGWVSSRFVESADASDASAQVVRLEEELVVARQEVATLSATVGSFQTEKREFIARLARNETAEEELSKIVDANRDLRKKLAATEEQVAALETEQQNLLDRATGVEIAGDELEQAMAVNQEMRSRLQGLDAELAEAEELADRLDFERQQAADRLAEYVAGSETADAELAQARAANVDLQSRLSAAEDSARTLEAGRQQLAEQLAERQVSADTAGTELAQALAEKGELQTRLANLEERAQSFETDRQGLSEKLATSNASAASAEQELDRVLERGRELQDRLTVEEGTVEQLQTELEAERNNATAVLAGTQVAVKDETEPCLSLRPDPTADNVPVDCLAPGTSGTIVAVRGEWLEWQLASGRRGWSSRQYLESTQDAELRSARAALEQTREESERARAELAQTKTQLTDIGGELERIRDQRQDMSGEVNDLRSQVVTLEEERRSFEAQASDAEALQERLAALEAENEKDQATRRELDDERRSLQASLNSTQSDLGQARDRLSRLSVESEDQERSQQTTRLEFEARMAALEAEIDRLEPFESVAGELVTANQALAEARAEATMLRESSRALSSKISDLESDVASARQEVADSGDKSERLVARVAELEELTKRLKGIETEFDEAANALTTSEARNRELEERVAGLEAGGRSFEEERDEARRSLASVQEEMSALREQVLDRDAAVESGRLSQAELDEVKNALSTSEARNRELAERVAGLETARRSSEEERDEARRRLASTRDQMSALREQVSDRDAAVESVRLSQAELDESKNTLSVSEGRNRELEERVAELEAGSQSLEAERDQAERSMASAQDQIKALQDQLAELEEAVKAVDRPTAVAQADEPHEPKDEPAEVAEFPVESAAPPSLDGRAGQPSRPSGVVEELEATPVERPLPETSVADVEAFVRAWAAAWSGQRVPDYLSFYSDRFLPAGDLPLVAWKGQRGDRLTRPEFIRVEVSDFAVNFAGTEQATVSFNQVYQSNTFRDRVRKMFDLAREGEYWRILTETAIAQ